MEAFKEKGIQIEILNLEPVIATRNPGFIDWAKSRIFQKIDQSTRKSSLELFFEWKILKHFLFYLKICGKNDYHLIFQYLI